MTPITEVSEALKLLNTLVERGEDKNLLWCGWCATFKKGTELEECVSCRQHLREPPLWFLSLVKGAEAVLKQYDRVHGAYLKKDQRALTEDQNAYLCGSHESIMKTVTGAANVYRPAMEELGWIPK